MMNGITNTQKGNFMKSEEDFVNEMKTALNNNNPKQLKECLINTKSDFIDGNAGPVELLASTRLSINGFWKAQLTKLDKIKETDGVEGVTEFVNQLDENIKKFKDSSYREVLKEYAIRGLDDGAVSQYGQALVELGDSGDDLSTEPDNLYEWVINTRMMIVEELSEAIQDYRESERQEADLDNYRETIESLKLRLEKIANGSLFQ